MGELMLIGSRKYCQVFFAKCGDGQFLIYRQFSLIFEKITKNYQFPKKLRKNKLYI